MASKGLRGIISNKSSLKTIIKLPYISIINEFFRVFRKNKTIYKDFRWNFVNPDDDPQISKAEPTVLFKNKSPIINTILELNETKTEILDSYYTKNYLASKLGITKLKVRNIILNNIKYNDKYYIEYHKCPIELIQKYNKPINRILPTHSKQIKQIHPITKEIVIFNSLSEISIKLNYSSKPILDAINNKLLYGGYLWEYYNYNK